MKFVDMKAPVPPTPPAAEAKPDKGGSAKGKKGKGSAGKKGGKGGGGAEATTPPPGTPPGGDKQVRSNQPCVLMRCFFLHFHSKSLVNKISMEYHALYI